MTPGLRRLAALNTQRSVSTVALIMAEYEAIFHATQPELLLPDHSAFASSSGAQTPRRDAAWWRELQRHRSRDVAFFDERLSYFFALHIPHRAFGIGSKHGYSGAQEELKRFLTYLQVSPHRERPP